MRNLVYVLALGILPLFLAPSSSAVQASPVPGNPAGVGPVDRNQCFKDYVANLKTCRDTFCPNRLTNCNQTALDACIAGAREVLRDCLEG